MCRSADEVTATADGYAISLPQGMTELNVGLMEGFLTSPFDSQPLKIFAYVDLDKRTGSVVDWQGGKNTYDLHSGTDGATSKAYAAAPGYIVSVRTIGRMTQCWPFLGIESSFFTLLVLLSLATRLDICILETWTPISEESTSRIGRILWLKGNMSALQQVRRGLVLASIGFTGNNPDNILHLHFEVNQPAWQTEACIMMA